MEIVVVVLALAFLQVWGSRNPLHKDQWFYGIHAFLEEKPLPSAELVSFLTVALPLTIVAIVFEVLVSQSVWLALPFAVVVLLYSFGRGEFFEIVREYTQACYVEDWDSASARADRFDVPLADLEEGDWPGLHRHVFDEAGYRGFERMFAVLFWFFVLGPIGALMYRLVILLALKNREDGFTRRWLWILEWPAVRLLGLSFALTGNFSHCIERWRDSVFCAKRSTIAVLSSVILGALSVGDEVEPDCEITRKELTLMSKLYQRTIWFWLAGASVIFIVL